MIRIEPLGTRIVLPAIVVGYEIVRRELKQQIDEFGECPNWIITLDQQAGGYSMSYPSVVGAVLRLADNAEHCRGDLCHLIRGSQAMAEDPNLPMLTKKYPVLRTLVCTWGEDYTRDQLQSLANFLEPFFRLPGFESGREAFIRFDRCDTWTTFGGWRLLQVTAPLDLPQIYAGQRAVSVAEEIIAKVTLSGESVLDLKKLGELEAIGNRIGDEGLRAFLLWENSD